MHDSNISAFTTSRVSISVIWVQDGSEGLNKFSILSNIRRIRGVEEVDFSREDPSILKIEYSKKRTNTDILLKKIQHQGIMAKLVDY